MKKSKLALTIALASVLTVAPALAGCSGDHYSSVSFPAQDTTYLVDGQGGSAVSYGNYVYFINGTRGYDDTDGKNNVWGDVVKGGLYRAELNGTKSDGKPARFTPTVDGKGFEFKHTDGKDYFDAPIDIVDVQEIAPKTIGTSGYSRGGLFVYDNNVYFASPVNRKSKTGKVETTRTDFFMMPLSGGSPTLLYTTSSGVDTSSAEYAFYKYGGYVYLVVNEGGTIVSVRIDAKKSKAVKTNKYEVGATSVFFPVRDEYYTGIDNNTPEDFIYFVRAVKDDLTDADGNLVVEQKAGTVIEVMRPDGSENFTVSMNGKTETIEAVRNGVLFYRTTDAENGTILAYDNLHDALMQSSPTYAAKQTELGDKANKQISGTFATKITSDMGKTYAFRDDTFNDTNVVYFISASDEGMRMYSTDGTVEQVTTSAGTVLFIENDYLYFSGASSDFYRTPLWSNMDDYGEAQKLAENTTSAGISCDYVAGYFTYFAKVDDWADAYTYFYKVDGRAGAEPQFVGQRSKDDIPTEEELDEIKNPSDDDETDGDGDGDGDGEGGESA